MEEYHKIQTLFKRHTDGKKKGKMIRGAWTTPELEYLARNPWEFTEKIDGTNIRIGYDLDPDHLDMVEFAGRSDNAVIPKPLMEVLEARFTPALFKSAGLNNIILFGEGYGPKIQNGGLYTGGERVHDFVLFDVKIGRWWLSRKDVKDIADKLGIDAVPLVGTGTLYDAIDIVSTGVTFTDTGSIMRWGSGTLSSRWGNFDAEGIVARPVVPMFDRKGERIITKIKKVDFK